MRWLGDAHDTAAVRIADALAEWGTAAALPAFAEAARRMHGARAGRLVRAERAIRARAFAGHDGGLALAGAGGGELALAEGPRDAGLSLTSPAGTAED